jgi:hypothetical protein
VAQIDQRIAQAEARLKEAHDKLKQAKALKQKQEARQRATLAKQERAADTRRKVLVGTSILAKVERGEWTKEKLLAMLDAALTRPHDRELFGLAVPQPQMPKDAAAT